MYNTSKLYDRLNFYSSLNANGYLDRISFWLTTLTVTAFALNIYFIIDWFNDE